jgi:hypothetical protein
MKRESPILLRPPASTAVVESGVPVISLVTCSYQQERNLEQAIRSVLGQRYPRLEYIVIDAGSTDGSVPIIQRNERALAHWESLPGCGQTDALVRGFRRATGEIHGWLCSDDLLLPGALEAVAEFFATHPKAMAAYGDALWIDADGRFLRSTKEMDPNRLVTHQGHNYTPRPSLFWRSTMYDAVNGLDPRFDATMDTAMWDRFSALIRVEHLPHCLSCMRWSAQQKMRFGRTTGRLVNSAVRPRGASTQCHARMDKVLWMVARGTRMAAEDRAGGPVARGPGHDLAWLERKVMKGAAR